MTIKKICLQKSYLHLIFLLYFARLVIADAIIEIHVLQIIIYGKKRFLKIRKKGYNPYTPKLIYTNKFEAI